MIKSILEAYFVEKYHQKPKLVKAPGRVNIIGEHTDYNMGYVLPAAIEKGIYFAVLPNTNNTISVETFLNQPETIIFQTNGAHSPFTAGWGNYFKAIIAILIEKDYRLRGLDCVFGGDIPIGAGLSSSAALCCGFIHAMAAVSGFSISKNQIAYIAQEAEHRIGLNCGIMDQYAVLFGKKANAIFLDCKTLSHKYVPINLEGYSWVLINSKIEHNLAVDSEYNKRRASCELVVQRVAEFKPDTQSLREVDYNDLAQIKSQVTIKDFTHAKYVLDENERVLRMIDALSSGNANSAGAILLDGHWAMANDFKITTTELDTLVQLGQDIQGVLGARMMGGGFGGCTINLMKSETAKLCTNRIIESYKKTTGITAEAYHLAIDDGVRTIEN